MKTLLDVGRNPRHLDQHIPHPLAQPGIVWHASTGLSVPPVPGAYPLRYSDPGGILELVSQTVGPPTAVCIMGDNIAGVAGWQHLPFERQYEAVSARAGAFVCGAMRYLVVRGPDAGRVIDMLTPRDILGLPVGRGMFALLTTAIGTVDTEAVVFRMDDQEYLMSIGGATREPSWLSTAVAAHPRVEVRETDVTNLNLKGPDRSGVIQRLIAPDDAARVARLRPFEGTAVRTAAGLPAHVLRTVIGMELWARPEAMRGVWRDILARPESVTPCGWDMVNTYRLECEAFVFGLCPLDLHSGTTLWEIGAERVGARAKDRDFLGRAALAAARNRRRLWLAGLVGAASGTDVPPVGTEVWRDDGAFAGYVTSAVHSPRHRRTLAFAHLKPVCAEKDDVTVDGTRWRVVRPPFTNPQLWS